MTKNQSLINKYRPYNLDDIIGQDNVINQLKKSLRAGRFPQFICLVGPSGVGKTSLAIALSRVVNCENYDLKEFRLCGSCWSCTAAVRNLTSWEFVSCAERGVTQEEIRQYTKLASTPFCCSKYRVIFFDEVHEWYSDRQAKLTSFLDAVGSRAYIICATYKKDELEKAFISRFVKFEMAIPTEDQVKSLLVKICKNEDLMLPDSVLENIAKKCWESPRTAVVELEKTMLDFLPEK